jgi:aryl-alcohol dehydrogenase-like predicted oxidoreductase
VEFRLLGDTGVRVSIYSLGSAMFGPWGNSDERECTNIIHRALDAGINLIDTADVYSDGQAEEIIGRAIHPRRDEVIVATKVHAPMGAGPNDRGNSRLWIMRAVEASLRRLATDHIDLYQVHRPQPETAIDETLQALSDLITQGKVRYIGSSTFQAWQQVEAQAASRNLRCARFICEQPPYSILVRSIERDVLPVAERYRLGVIVWSPLAGGWLAGKYGHGKAPPPGSRAARFREYRSRGGRMDERYQLSNRANQDKFRIVDNLADLAAQAGLPLLGMALAFTLSHPAVTSSIIGPRTQDQLDLILAQADTRLDDATLDSIDELMPPGTVINPADLGWDLPWMAASSRRRVDLQGERHD